MEETFGSFITRKRKEQNISLREFARRVAVSPEHICNMEKCRRPAPGGDKLETFAVVLDLSREERQNLFDLASSSKNTENALPEDLSGFVHENRVVLTALRTARDMDATDEEWQTFMEMLQANRAVSDAP